MEQQTFDKGYITLLTVIIVSAILSFLVLNLILVNTLGTQTLNYSYIGNQNFYHSQSCLEDALYNIRLNNAYSSNGSLTLDEGSCSYTITIGSGENRVVNVASLYLSSTKRIKYYISSLNPKININYMEEVITF